MRIINGIRCFARYVYEMGYVKSDEFTVETGAGILVPKIIKENNVIAMIQVDMGEPILEGDKIPVAGYGMNRVVNEDIQVEGQNFKMTCVSMGNPHCVVFVEDAENFPIFEIGHSFEIHEKFPRKTNTEFVQVLDRQHLRMRVWAKLCNEEDLFMIKSMTGFGAGDAETADFKVHIEVKAVNQRFLETNYHMPYSMNMFENQLTKKIKEYASRGKLDINIRFQDLRDKAVTVKVDKGLVAAYGQALQEISSQLELSAPVTAAQIASYPDVLKLNEENADLEAAQPVLMQAMEQALESFVAMREAEGQNIQRDLLARIGTLENFVEELEKLAPEIVAAYRQRLENLLRKYLAKEDIEESRIIQEVALFTDKVNYTEETVRLRSHFDQFRQIITAGEPVGRKLDFLIQEMNREINTVASKANSAGAAQFVVDVKSEIEKIREQIQNIE